LLPQQKIFFRQFQRDRCGKEVRGRGRRERRRRNCGCSGRHDEKEKQRALDTI